MNTDMMEALQALAAERGHLGRRPVRGACRRPRVRLQADARRLRVRLGDDRPRDHGHSGCSPRSSTKKASPIGDEFEVTPGRLRPHRRPDGASGHDPAHPRGRTRAQVRGVRRPRGRHRHRHDPADRQRATPCSISVGSRPCCRRPSRCPTSAPIRTCGIKAYIVEVRKTAKGPQIVVSRTHPGSGEAPVRARGARDRRRRRRDQGLRTRTRAPHQDRRLLERLRTSIRWVPVSGPVVRASVRSSTSSAARRSTSCPSPRISTSS